MEPNTESAPVEPAVEETTATEAPAEVSTDGGTVMPEPEAA